MVCYYKVRQLFYYKVGQVLLQSATGITKCDNFITKCDDYYKVRQYTPPSRNPWITPRGFFSKKIFECMTYGGYAIFVPYVGVEEKLRRSENFLYDLVQELFVARRQFLNQV